MTHTEVSSSAAASRFRTRRDSPLSGPNGYSNIDRILSKRVVVDDWKVCKHQRSNNDQSAPRLGGDREIYFHNALSRARIEYKNVMNGGLQFYFFRSITNGTSIPGELPPEGNTVGGIMRESLRRLASDDGMERRTGTYRRVRIELLDGEHINIDIDRKAKGSDLLDKVCDTLDIIEKDFFGLLHAQRGDPRVWVDLGKRLAKTFRNEPWDVRLAAKFYPPEPSELRDDNTRFQLALAVRRDLMEGRLTCSTITLALLASYVLQAEMGDYEESRMTPLVLAEYRATPVGTLTDELEAKIVELYIKHKGLSPAEAELNYLENAKKLSLYGAELHHVRDSEDIDIALAVSAAGVSVYRDGILMNKFPWAKITKICYNKRNFTLKLRPTEFDQFETHLTFRLNSSRSSKKLWRCAVEHHMFFRREAPVPVDRISGFPRLGSRRVSCRRTLRQMRADLPFTREITAS